jgi:DNA polymerase V
MYALVDCNNFYVSCERVFQPQLIGKPVVVLSNNDGCVISRSEEAKAIGIPMGAPEFKFRDMLQQHSVSVFSSNYSLYGDLSGRVMRILENFTPHVEVYSIDEAFLNFKGQNIPDYNDYGAQIRKRILKWIGIPVCVGIAPTKALSKIANRIAKKFFDHTKGTHVIDTEEKRIKALKWTKIEDVWGIGRRLSKKMKAQQILNAYDFTLEHNKAYIKKEMGVVGLRLICELQGLPVMEQEETKPKKNIAVTRSFEKSISQLDELKERVSTFASVCAEKLRKQQSCCYTLIIFIQKDRFQDAKYHFQTIHTLPYASNSSITLSNLALKMLNEIYQEGGNYKKAGVIVSQIIPEEQKQLQLFDEENPKHQLLMKAIDNYHAKIGERKIRLGNQDLQRTWKMKQNHLSKRYTTCINELMEVKC